MDLVKDSIIDDPGDDVANVVGLVGVVGDDVEEFIIAPVRRVFRGPPGWVFLVVLRDVLEQLADTLEAFRLRLTHEVSNTGRGAMDLCAAQLFEIHLLMSDRPDNVRSRHEHVGDPVDHVDKVGDRG